MSNEKQETITDIVADIRAQNQGLPEDEYALSPLVADLLSFADRIEAAEKREVEELRECLKEAIREKCPFTWMSCKHGEPCEYACGTDKWRKVLEGAVDKFCANCTASDDDCRELCDRCVTLDWKEALAEIQNQP